MVIGYFEGVNRIVLIDNEGKRHDKKLSVNGINVLSEKFYSYYDIMGELHIINMNYARKLKLYKDKELIYEL